MVASQTKPINGSLDFTQPDRRLHELHARILTMDQAESLLGFNLIRLELGHAYLETKHNPPGYYRLFVTPNGDIFVVLYYFDKEKQRDEYFEVNLHSES